MAEWLLGLTAKTAGCQVIVEGRMNRPPYTESTRITSYYADTEEVAQPIALALPTQHSSGGSDGNFSWVLRVPMLDDPGCPGLGAHASHGQIL